MRGRWSGLLRLPLLGALVGLGLAGCLTEPELAFDNPCDPRSPQADRCATGAADGARPGPADGGARDARPADDATAADADADAGPCAPTAEICNGRDDDCDGAADERLVEACFGGPDGRLGVGLCRGGQRACVDGLFGTCQGDVAPAEEICDAFDNDCDGAVDEVGGCECADGDMQDCYAGPAGTAGVGACRAGRQQCEGGFFAACADQVLPDDEVCNRADDDCDGSTDEGLTNACGGCGPAPAERCNEIDDDCDGDTDEGLENCGCAPVAEICNQRDDDCDGAVDEGLAGCGCEARPEACNGADDDCDGRTDEGVRNACGACGAVPVEACNGADDDCDGSTDEGTFGRCVDGQGACAAEGDFRCVEGATRCVATLPAPSAETCNGVDDDCDGLTDEDAAQACETDCGAGARACRGGRLQACDARTPAAEVCNQMDDDCDGVTDEETPLRCGCTPAAEVCNEADDDCDGQTDEGLLNACGGCGPAPAEVCNGADDDCDGSTDERVTNACGDCGPAPAEVCNGADDDCDGRTDEGALNACGACGPVPDERCDGQDDDCDGNTDEGVANACGGCGAVPAELCNGVDDDCDGATDEDAQAACDTACGPGQRLCEGGDLGPCVGPPPQPELCNGDDDDCDGTVDEDTGLPCATACGVGTLRCVEGVVSGCDAPQPRAEMCNGLDDDCDGPSDEGVANACGRCGLVPAETCNGADDDCDGNADENGARLCEAVHAAGQCVAGECAFTCEPGYFDVDRRSGCERGCGAPAVGQEVGAGRDPVIAADGGRVAIAYTDANGQLVLADTGRERPLLLPVGEGFAPFLTDMVRFDDGWLLTGALVAMGGVNLLIYHVPDGGAPVLVPVPLLPTSAPTVAVVNGAAVVAFPASGLTDPLGLVRLDAGNVGDPSSTRLLDAADWEPTRVAVIPQADGRFDVLGWTTRGQPPTLRRTRVRLGDLSMVRSDTARLNQLASQPTVGPRVAPLDGSLALVAAPRVDDSAVFVIDLDALEPPSDLTIVPPPSRWPLLVPTAGGHLLAGAPLMEGVGVLGQHLGDAKRADQSVGPTTMLTAAAARDRLIDAVTVEGQVQLVFTTTQGQVQWVTLPCE